MRTLCIIFALIFWTKNCAQKNTLFFELGGNAQGSSLNYERQLTKEKGLMFTIGVGLALVNEEKVQTGSENHPKSWTTLLKS